MNMVAVQFGIVILAAMAGYSIFGRLRLPRALGGVLAGIVVGPSFLGSVPVYGFPLGIFPAIPSGAVSPELFAFSTVAAILFLFFHGLETDVSLLRRNCAHGCLLAAAGITVSFVLGDLIGIKLMKFIGTASTFMSPECLFFGMVSTATSAGIAVRAFSKKRKLDSPEAATYFACAASDSVLSIVLLAIVLGSIGSLFPAHGIRSYTPQALCGSPGVVAIWLLLLLAALWVSGRSANFHKVSDDRSNMALVFLGLTLAAAGLLECAGLASVLGAYVA
ncbi:MAG: cation:proton antiporter, partial [bacterium]